MRLVDTGVQNVSALSAKVKISRHWAALTPDADQFFGSELSDARAAMLSLGITSDVRLAGLFSIASMIAVMNSVVAGSGVTLAVVSAAGSDRMGVCVLAGVVAGLLAYGWFLTYQSRRYRVLLAEPPDAESSG